MELDPTNTQVSPISGASPRDVVASFLRLTVDTPNLEKAKLHLTKRSTEGGSFHAANVPPGSTYTLGGEEADGLGRRIPVSVKSPVPGGSEMQEMTVPVVVVQEEGEWRIDLPATMERLMGGMSAAIGQAVGAMGEALGTAMETVGDAISSRMSSKPEAPAPAPKKTAKVPPAKAAPAKASKVKPKAKTAPVKKAAKSVHKPTKSAPKKSPTKIAKPGKKRAKPAKTAKAAKKKRR